MKRRFKTKPTLYAYSFVYHVRGEEKLNYGGLVMALDKQHSEKLIKQFCEKNNAVLVATPGKSVERDVYET